MKRRVMTIILALVLGIMPIHYISAEEIAVSEMPDTYEDEKTEINPAEEAESELTVEADEMLKTTEDAKASETIIVESGSTIEMELNQTYQISSPAYTTTSYIFRFTPEEDAGYYLDYNRVGSYELGLTCYVMDEEEHVYASGTGYYMLEKGKTYVYEMNAIPNYRPMSATGTLKMTRTCDWDACVLVEDGIATGLSYDFDIVYLPDGVKAMKQNPYIYQLGTLVLPESIQDPINNRDFWKAYYRYETPGNGGRYVAEEGGVLYDQKNQILRYVPGFMGGSYTVKEGTTEIGTQAFAGTNLEEIIFPDSVKYFDSEFRNVFGSNSTIKRIKLPAHVEKLEATDFYGLYALQSLEIPENSEKYVTRDDVLFEKNRYEEEGLILTFYPIGKQEDSYIIPDDVIEIAWGAFSRARDEDDAVRNLKYLTIPKTVKYFGNFLHTGGSNNSYTEITLRGYEDSAAYQYWQENYSLVEQIKWETIGESEEDPIRNFALKIDNNSFYHYGLDNKESGFWGTKGIWLTSDDYEKLFSHKMDDGTRNHLRNIINGKIKWGGSCYGIASVIGRVFNQDMDISDISNSGKSCIYDLENPNQDKKYLSTISYYQLMQYIYKREDYELASVFHSQPDILGSLLDFVRGTDSETISTPEEFQTFFQTVISTLDQGKVLLLHIPSHSVLITDYKITDDGYSFEIYDENSVEEELPEGEFYELQTNRDFTEFTCDGLESETLTKDNFGYFSITLPADSEQNPEKEPQHGGTGIYIDALDSFTIQDSDGKKLSSDGSTKVEATMNVKELQFIESSLGDETKGESESINCKFTVDDGNTYTISDLGEEANIALYNNSGYLSLVAEEITSAKLTPGKEIIINGEENYSFVAVIDTDEKVAENETGLVAVSGTADGVVTIQTSGDTVKITSEEGVQDLEIESFVGNESKPLEIKGENDDALEAGEELDVKATDFIEEEPKPDEGLEQAKNELNSKLDAYEKLAGKADVPQEKKDEFLQVIEEVRNGAESAEDVETIGKLEEQLEEAYEKFQKEDGSEEPEPTPEPDEDLEQAKNELNSKLDAYEELAGKADVPQEKKDEFLQVIEEVRNGAESAEDVETIGKLEEQLEEAYEKFQKEDGSEEPEPTPEPDEDLEQAKNELNSKLDAYEELAGKADVPQEKKDEFLQVIEEVRNGAESAEDVETIGKLEEQLEEAYEKFQKEDGSEEPEPTPEPDEDLEQAKNELNSKLDAYEELAGKADVPQEKKDEFLQVIEEVRNGAESAEDVETIGKLEEQLEEAYEKFQKEDGSEEPEPTPEPDEDLEQAKNELNSKLDAYEELAGKADVPQEKKDEFLQVIEEVRNGAESAEDVEAIGKLEEQLEEAYEKFQKEDGSEEPGPTVENPDDTDKPGVSKKPGDTNKLDVMEKAGGVGQDDSGNAVEQKEDAARTGDTSMYELWLLVAGISGIAAVTTILARKRRRRK